ncbi:MAG: hypothetical protein O2923_14995, partial [Verrucomicrobia bacterium]|nr:hypothetical protein [Verrucomicrobiota bacterium]
SVLARSVIARSVLARSVIARSVLARSVIARRPLSGPLIAIASTRWPTPGRLTISPTPSVPRWSPRPIA